MAFSLATGLLYALFANRSRQRNFGSTMYANRRRRTMRTPKPLRRPAPEDPTST
jgi:hypothetical protein